MTKFTEYFLMNSEDAQKYAFEKTDIFTNLDNLKCEEIGDGNLNYVFKIQDIHTGHSIILKQASTIARISDEIKLSTNRIRIESDILSLYGKFTPEHAPKVFSYDSIMNCFLMEDLSDHAILRSSLNKFQTYPNLADHLSTFITNVLLPTTDFIMDHQEKKNEIKRFINPDLCDISEELVFTEPYTNHNNRNLLFEPHKEWLQSTISDDLKLHFEAAKLKWKFMNNPEALIHGDLHTGSIFVTKDSTKVIDPEFAFYGPIGYDIGNVIANMLFAHVRAYVYKQSDYLKWSEKTIVQFVDLTFSKMESFLNSQNTHSFFSSNSFISDFLTNVKKDTAGMASLEMIRRTIGLAQVIDITSIEDDNLRMFAEKVIILTAKHYMLNPSSLLTGQDYMNILNEKLSEAKNYENN